MVKIAVVGAGFAGLVATQRSLATGAEVICYEQSESIGGTWVYNQKHHSKMKTNVMYGNLITNQPKELMALPLFPNKANIVSP